MRWLSSDSFELDNRGSIPDTGTDISVAHTYRPTVRSTYSPGQLVAYLGLSARS
jgi:hypothetical protein